MSESHKSRPYIKCCLITAIIAIGVAVAIAAPTVDDLSTKLDAVNVSYQESQKTVQGLTMALQEQAEKTQELSETILKLQSEIEELKFKANPNSPLPDDMSTQEFSYWMCVRHGVKWDTFQKLVMHESGGNADAVGYNSNGTTDHGYCQVNTVNHGWLMQEYGLDVKNDSRDNITAGILMLSMFLEKYPDELQALAAYAAGESGMKRGGGYARAMEILSTEI